MLGEIKWFKFRSKRDAERDREEYEAWAFPYGKAQSDKIKGILKDLFPNEDPQISLVSFLTAKEIFNNSVSDDYYSPEGHEEAISKIKKDLKRFDGLFSKGTDTTYMALAMADRVIGPELQYPDYESIRATAKKLNEEIAQAKTKWSL